MIMDVVIMNKLKYLIIGSKDDKFYTLREDGIYFFINKSIISTLQCIGNAHLNPELVRTFKDNNR